MFAIDFLTNSTLFADVNFAPIIAKGAVILVICFVGGVVRAIRNSKK